MTSTPAPPPGYEDTAAQLRAEGVPPEIANNPNDTSGLALWLQQKYDAA